MIDREKVIKEYEDYVNSYISLTTSHDYEFEMHKAVLTLLKEQEAEIRQLRLALNIAKGTCKGIALKPMKNSWAICDLKER